MAKKFEKRSHRAACRPVTPLSELNTAQNRRKAAAVAATGLGVAFVVSSQSVTADAAPQGADVAQLAQQAKDALKSNPQVTVAADTKWDDSVKTTATAVETPTVEAAVAENVREDRPAQRANNAAAAVADAGATNVPPSAVAGSIVDVAMRYQGVPYSWGGTTPKGFDCSGFVGYVYAQKGIKLPRTSQAQAGVGRRVARSAAQPGDMLNWGGHVAIYVGNGMMIDAPKPGDRVRVRPVYGNPQVRRV